ncbi:MAG TPA: UDP-N-acetylglucosamine--N-acetylmuramyl-(pentapeptide) pyrophosphoryl-undecaprenol N-acetylglucosamine transferase [Negativicutes bacterium]|nr:UDP-N-acetylglucosamine--N-acetylmuramyl-(pentapeptide) pyrophosphoryl-undecaprenol N-acetylglucosamine transferase [Negativicutes bacterium]
MKIVFTGGGTGGHLFPIIAIARELWRLAPEKNLKLYYLGPHDKDGLLELSQEPQFTVKTVASGKIRRYFSLRNFVDVLIAMPLGFLQSFFLLLVIRPQLVFSKGGSGSAMVTFAARVLGIPIFIHESDIVPGMSNTAICPWATKIFTSFERTEYFDPAKTMVTGNPVKKELQEGNKESAKDLFGLTLKKPVLLFMGGSQGAEPINDFVLSALSNLLESYEIIHAAGNKHYASVKAEADVVMDQGLAGYYHLYPTLNEIALKHAYAAADIIISRAGSGSIFEIAAAGKPSILIPLPGSAGDHQSKNAYAYAVNGATVVIEQENLTPNFFAGKIHFLLSQPEKMKNMSEAARQFAKPLAAKAIAREILEFLGNPKS